MQNFILPAAADSSQSERDEAPTKTGTVTKTGTAVRKVISSIYIVKWAELSCSEGT